MIGQYLGRIMDDIKEKLAVQSEERNMALIQELKDDMTKATTVDIPQLNQQIETVASAQKSGEAKLKAEIKEFFDEGNNSIVTDIGKIYRQCAEQINKVQQQSDTTSEVMQELSASLKSLEEASVNATALQDVKESIKDIQVEMAKLATSVKYEELRKLTEDKLREQGERNITMERRMEELKEMFAAVEEQTEEYNRRSQELDIVYNRIKAHIEQLKKGPDLKQTAEPSNTVSKDVTRIQSDISTLRTVHSNLNATIQAVGADVKIIQAEQSRTTAKFSKLVSSIASGDVVRGLQGQIGQLHEKIMQLAKRVHISDQGSEIPTSEIAAYQTQIPTHSRTNSVLDHLNEDQLVSNRIDASKAIRYLEAKMVINEQLNQIKLQDLTRDISNLRKRKNPNTEPVEPEAKHSRNDTSTPSHSDLQDTVDEHTVQLKDLISFLEPLRTTVLSDVFPDAIQKNFNQLISVSQ
jgi:hypothetical protein